MDLSHRLPFPEIESYLNIFHNAELSLIYQEMISNNIKKSVLSFSKIIKQLNFLENIEIFAFFNASRFLLTNNSQKLRKESLIFLNSLLDTFLFEDCIPYLLLLTHDENLEIKKLSIEFFSKITRKIGGLSKCLSKVISAIGSMGALAFKDINLNNIEETQSKSRLASLSILSSTQLLILFKNQLNHKEYVELLQYLPKANEGISNHFKDPNIFYNQKLRCSLYRLYQETILIQKCPNPNFNLFLNENDSQCIKFLGPLIQQLFKKIDWDNLILNEKLKEKLFEDFLKFSKLESISYSMKLNISNKNIINAVKFLISKNNIQYINFSVLSLIPQIWNEFNDDIISEIIKYCNIIDAKFISIYSKFFKNITNINFVENNTIEEISKAIILISNKEDIPYIIKKWPNCIHLCIKQWNKSLKTDWWCSELKDNLLIIIENDITVLINIIPNDYFNEFNFLITNLIIKKIQNNLIINYLFWNYCFLNEELINLIVLNDILISNSSKKFLNFYHEIFNYLIINKGYQFTAIYFGKLYLKDQNILINSYPKNFEFLNNYFLYFPLNKVPFKINIFYINKFIKKKLLDFLLLLYLNQFKLDYLDQNICEFLLNYKDFQELYNYSKLKNFQNVILLLLFINNKFNFLNEIWITPFFPKLINFENKTNEDIEFIKFCNNLNYNEKIFDKNYTLSKFMFISNLNLLDNFLNFIENFIPTTSSLDFYLSLNGLLIMNLDNYIFIEILIKLISNLEILPLLNIFTYNLLLKCFQKTSNFNINEIIFFIDQISTFFISSNGISIIKCLENVLEEYFLKLSQKDWIKIREILSKGQISNLIVFDSLLIKYFKTFKNDLNKLIDLLKDFPEATSRWRVQDEEILIFEKQIIEKVSDYLINKSFNLIKNLKILNLNI